MSGMQKQLYGIAIFEEEIVLSDFTAKGERRYVVTPDQLMGFVRSEVTFRPFPGLIWMKCDGRKETYLLTLTAGPRTILYREKKKLVDYRLVLPSIAVKASVGLVEHKITSIDIWGFRGNVLGDETILYELPLPNLSRSSMCLGSTERVVGGNVREAIERTIFDTPFNHHNHIVGIKKIPFQDYVAKHKGCCPVRTLNVIGSGKQILRNLI